mmetsp:Transcript_12501/g.15847  ORF Transcript_12501/g.15847 Transcript_12501/m.15847 type:complete len:321 (+) Transcript_12501:31-993(+)|eukprot:CAMPEP_0203709252 /NCGR_PEP_ID=MMETSP0091-20130426/61416_1 /ASSEMBLY_ACC=CAM_ASM_001089 /TAXON_ID=426623 /ORGANISM="Chaetoceros affinis, Strain CCMP159" /LENGTH=320 /DNA_ID=CAMNT_0050586213 /DNA_START=24 /DNA_END=986 /DNA_ORIENTATION=+
MFLNKNKKSSAKINEEGEQQEVCYYCPPSSGSEAGIRAESGVRVGRVIAPSPPTTRPQQEGMTIGRGGGARKDNDDDCDGIHTTKLRHFAQHTKKDREEEEQWIQQDQHKGEEGHVEYESNFDHDSSNEPTVHRAIPQHYYHYQRVTINASTEIGKEDINKKKEGDAKRISKSTSAEKNGITSHISETRSDPYSHSSHQQSIAKAPVPEIITRHTNQDQEQDDNIKLDFADQISFNNNTTKDISKRNAFVSYWDLPKELKQERGRGTIISSGEKSTGRPRSRSYCSSDKPSFSMVEKALLSNDDVHSKPKEDSPKTNNKR